MIDLDQQILSLEEAARILPGRPCKKTIRRWISRGVAGGIRLRSFKNGARRYTTREWCEEFLAAQNVGRFPKASKKTSAHVAAEAALDGMGIFSTKKARVAKNHYHAGKFTVTRRKSHVCLTWILS